MTQSSVSGYVLRSPVTAFEARGPMSSYRAWENRQNLMHLTDESAQHRINWVTPDSAGYGIETTGTTDETPTWSATYPHTWLAPGKPANLALYVQGHHCYVRARLVPWNSTLLQRDLDNGNNSAPAVFDTTLDLTSPTPTADGYLYIVNGIDLDTFNLAWMSPGIVVGSDGVAYQPQVCLMRLELQLVAEVGARVFGVLLRECA